MNYKHASDEVSTVSTNNSCYVILLLVKCEIIWKHSTTLNVGGEDVGSKRRRVERTRCGSGELEMGSGE